VVGVAVTLRPADAHLRDGFGLVFRAWGLGFGVWDVRRWTTQQVTATRIGVWEGSGRVYRGFMEDFGRVRRGFVEGSWRVRGGCTESVGSTMEQVTTTRLSDKRCAV
jgi:hypothetical protein